MTDERAKITGRRAKLKNRRCTLLCKIDDEGIKHWQMQFKRLGESGEPRVVETVVNLSDEAMCEIIAMFMRIEGVCTISWVER